MGTLTAWEWLYCVPGDWPARWISYCRKHACPGTKEKVHRRSRLTVALGKYASISVIELLVRRLLLECCFVGVIL
jgi:hypothetical protein